MKLRWKIITVLATVTAAGALLLLNQGWQERRAVEKVRETLRQQGFKTDLTDFDFSLPAEFRSRATALTNTEPGPAMTRNLSFPWRSFLFQNQPQLLTAVGTNAALVIWQEIKLPPSRPVDWLQSQRSGTPTDDLWPLLRNSLDEQRSELDAACQAALSGPIRFDLNARQGQAMLLRHLSVLRNLGQTLALRSILDIHDRQRDAAWTNLMALTRLVTAWDPEPCEVSHLVRYGCAVQAYDATWQALQFEGWSDGQLTALQHNWETADFLQALPQTQAFARACHADTCERERQQPMGFAVPLTYIIRSPRAGFDYLHSYWRRLQYRQHGSYEDEKALMLFDRDREEDMTCAIKAQNWLVMRTLPGVTNPPVFRSPYNSSLQAMLNLKTLNARMQGLGESFLARAAEAESRRRIIITAIALTRHYKRHGAYPSTLTEIDSEILKSVPLDFMDGHPLRYRLAEDGHFVLYSVGLDCLDNEGKFESQKIERGLYPNRQLFANRQHSDLIWPRPATAEEGKVLLDEQRRIREEERQRASQAAESQMQQDEEERRVAVQELLNTKPPPRTIEPSYQGQPLSKLLRGQRTPVTNGPSIDELLTPRQILTGDEPDLMTFEVPADYSAVTNIGRLELLVDTESANLSKSDGGQLEGCVRSTNGGCRLVWNTAFDAPGPHAIRAAFYYAEGNKKRQRPIEIIGPVTPYFSSNICQFVEERCDLSAQQLILYAKLPEANATYSAELKSPVGAHLKTLTGGTSNGVIELHWNRVDDQGKTNTDNSVDSVFRVTLTDSGRSMTQRGP